MSRFSAYMRGQTGAQGPQGSPSIIDGIVSTTSQLPSSPNEGTSYLVGTEAPRRLYIYINGEWEDQGSILGAGFGQPTGSIETISGTTIPQINVTVDEASPDSAKVFNFDFKLPPGPEGKAGYGAYKEIQFTTEDSENYSWNSNILQIDRTELKLIPVYIKNSNDEVIEVDFTITEDNNQQNPNKILCTLPSKISGTLYCIAPINRGTITIGEVSTTTGDTATIWNTGTDNDAILNFELPRGEKGDTALTARIGSVTTTDSTTASVTIDGTKDLYFNFSVPRGNGIQKIEKIDSSELVDTYEITYSNGTTTSYTITNGKSVTHSWNGTFLTINSASGQSTENLQGPPGPPGPAGATGPQGPQGPTALTAQIGTVSSTNGEPSVTIEGEQNLVFNFELPQGIKGETGDIGQPAGFGINQIVNTQTLASNQDAYVTIDVDETSPNSAKIFKFGFGIPKGIQGERGPQGIPGVQNPIVVLSEEEYDAMIEHDPEVWYFIRDY